MNIRWIKNISNITIYAKNISNWPTYGRKTFKENWVHNKPMNALTIRANYSETKVSIGRH